MFRPVRFVFLFMCYFRYGLSREPSVIIIGAGSAGIAAGARLLENSISDITILEAEERIGGRIHTLKFGDGIVEMGAEVCDGIKDNIVYELVKDLNLLNINASIGLNKLYYSDGSKIDSTLSEDIGKIVQGYVPLICNERDGASVGEAFTNKYKSRVLDKHKNDENKLKVAKEGIKFSENVLLTMEGTSSWLQPSAKKHNRNCRSDTFLSWKGKGFQVIFDILTKKYPDASTKLPIDDKIHLHQKVSKIIWNDENVKVETTQSSVYTADYVIFTPSVGVLKEQKMNLFNPQLPDQKLEVLDNIGFGGMMKIFLHFPSKWWTNEIFFFLWSEKDLADVVNDNNTWLSHIPFLTQVPDNTNVLAIWIGGALVPQIELFPDEQLLNGCNFVIKKFLGKDYNVIPADKLKRTEWYSNPNFRGTFSFEKKEYFHDNVFHQKELAEPLKNGNGKPVVLFAGEATSPHHYGTVQGAIESGQREAERIINLHKH